MASSPVVPQTATKAESPAASLTLDQAVEEGCRNNPDLLAAHFEIPMACADELTAGLWGNPSLQIGATWEPLGGGARQFNDETPGQTNIGLSLPLDLSGKRGASVKSARVATRFSELSYLDAVRQKCLEIRQAYIDVMITQNELSLAAEKESDYEKLVHIIENRMGKKSVRPLLLVRAHLARDQARVDLRQSRAELTSAKTSLAILLGRAPDEKAFEAVTELRDFSLPETPEREASVAQAMQSRPDLLALKATADKAVLDRDLARHQAWDDFNLALTLGRQSPIAANPEDPASVDVPAGYSLDGAVVIPMPLFNRNQGNIRKAELAVEQAEKKMASLQLTIRQEIGDELEQLQLNHELILEYESTQIKNARLVRDSQQTQFGTGYIALLDYFDAVEAYNNVLSSYYQAVGSYRKSLAMLNASVGTEALK